MAFAKYLLITALVGTLLQEIYGHGMMMDPVSRSSAWRKGFDTPQNYNDNELFCGGYGVHFGENKGNCGLCGDNYKLPQPRPNENGGVYGTGTIVAKYSMGETVKMQVKLSANHLGTFEFAICPLGSRNELETEECFAKFPLRLADGSDKYTIQSQSQYDFSIPVVLPKDLTCEQCVVRWTYRAGNNWGECVNGTGDLGCGDQETFKNCADVTISG